MVLAPKHKRPSAYVHHKKRYGQHRKQTKPYLRTYWPYLPIALIIGVGLLVNHLWSTNLISFSGDTSKITYSHLLFGTNKERASAKEQPLHFNNQLALAAQNQADYMATGNYWSPVSPSGQQPGAWIKQAGYTYESASENLAYGFSDTGSILSSWMNSQQHKSNILNTNYKDVGFGVARAKNYRGEGSQTIIVAVYGQPAKEIASANSKYSLSPTTAVIGSTDNPNNFSQHIARIQLITNSNAPWSLTILLSIFIVGLAILIIRHSLFWRMTLKRSEVFVIRHPWVDMFLVAIVMSSFILSRGAGNIL